MNLIPRNFFLDDFFTDLDFRSNNDFKCDIYEKDGEYNIELDAPGVKKEDMTVEYDKGYLTIAIASNDEIVDETKNYIRKERTSKEYKRQFYVGEIDAESIKAEFKDGIIKITTPKAKENTTKKLIEIK